MMEIRKIILRVWKQSLLSERTEVVYDKLESKRINIFLMPNSAWKSLIFNALEHLLSANYNEKYIKDTNKDLEAEIVFSLNNELYNYISTFWRKFKILKKWKEIHNFEEILEEYLWISNEKLEYYGSTKNSLFSLNRFNFLDFSTIFDKENTNEISFIDARHDGISKKFILAYVLWAKIDGWFFKKITEYEYKKDFINKNKKKFEKHIQSLRQISLLDTNLRKSFIELEDYRVLYWDLAIALKEISLLREEYMQTFWNNKGDEDMLFLNLQIQELKNDRSTLDKKIIKIRETIKSQEFIEEKKLVWDKRIKRKEIEDFENYIKYKEDIEKFDDLKIWTYMEENIIPHITSFKYFLSGLYDIFVHKLVEKKLVREDVFEKWNILFKEETLTIEALFKTSEWMRKTIRILAFIWLHIFSEKALTKCLNYSFYDSFIENIDFDFRDVLFDSIFDFVEQEWIKIPMMFFFITKIEKDNDSSIYQIFQKNQWDINLIESLWLK